MKHKIWTLPFMLATLLMVTSPPRPSEPQAPALTNAGLQAITFKPRFQGRSGGEIAQDNPRLPRRRVHEFRIEQGTFGLVPSRNNTRLLQNFSKVRSEPAAADVASWLAVAAENLDTQPAKVAKRGIKLTPEDTRIAAVVPVLYTAGDPRLSARLLGEFSKMGDRADRQVTLAFFDRPCRIEGTWTPRRANFSVLLDVNIPGPGLHALVWVKESEAPNQYRLVIDNSLSDLEFVTTF